MKNTNVKRLCLLAVLTAITVILAMTATFRIGNGIKIPLKFITVFLTGAVFGPLWAGAVAAAADILNSVLIPVGPPLIEITAIEFLSGIIYGLFFVNAKDNRLYYLRAVICSSVQFAVSIFLTSAVLTNVGYFPDYKSAIIIRLPAAIILFAVQTVFICIAKKYVFRLSSACAKRVHNTKREDTAK